MQNILKCFLYTLNKIISSYICTVAQDFLLFAQTGANRLNQIIRSIDYSKERIYHHTNAILQQDNMMAKVAN